MGDVTVPPSRGSSMIDLRRGVDPGNAGLHGLCADILPRTARGGARTPAKTDDTVAQFTPVRCARAGLVEKICTCVVRKPQFRCSPAPVWRGTTLPLAKPRDRCAIEAPGGTCCDSFQSSCGEP